jgi:hypothetical protein
VTDDRLRDLRRRAADDPDAARLLLSESVRSGDLTPERVGVLAYLGDLAAAAVWRSLGNEPPPTWNLIHASLERVSDAKSRRSATERRLWARWAAGLSRLGREASVRIALAAIRACDPSEEELLRVRGAEEAVRDWLEDKARDVGDYERLAEGLTHGDPRPVQRAAAAAARAAGSLTPEAAADYAALALRAIPAQGATPADVHFAALAQVRAHLGAWALAE